MSTIVSSFDGRVEIMKKKGENISTSSPIWWDFRMMPPKCGGPVITFIGACRRKMFKFGIKWWWRSCVSASVIMSGQSAELYLHVSASFLSFLLL